MSGISRAVALASNALVLLALLSTPSSATQIQPLGLAELGQDASLVVRGEVEDLRSYWNSDRTRILTEVSVRVAESFKGSVGSTVRVVQMGGVVDGVRMTVHGALTWDRGEEVVLFLAPSLPGLHRVSGFSQGKFEVVREGGEVMVRRPTLGTVEWVGIESVASSPRRELRLGLPELIDRSLSAGGGE